MAGFKMSIGGRGRGNAVSAARGRGRGTGCALFKLDDEPVRPLLLLGERPSAPTAKNTGAASTVEVDALDAFMEANTKEAAMPNAPATTDTFQEKPAWEELEADDPVASYCEAYQEGKAKTREDGSGSDASDDELDVDEETGERKRKAVPPLPRVEHGENVYAEVQTNFYTPHAEIENLTPDQVFGLKKDLDISVVGPQCPSPVVSFAHLGLPASLMEGIRKHGYTKPTPIQAQAIPAGLSGRDVVGVAETGSGKTVAYLMPMLVHCAAQPELEKDEGPIGVVLVPTRELAIQVEKEVFKFNKLLGLRSTTLAGGLSKKEQFKDIKRGSEIIIANPGRMIDIVKAKGFNLKRCSFIVLDEADRMLHMGFEYQVRSIVQNIRPNRQTLLFSATLPPKIERLASDLLRNPVRIVVGTMGNVAITVKQSFEVLDDDDAKWSWLAQRIDGMLAKGQLLIFVKAKVDTDKLVQNFTDLLEKKAVALHGDMDQGERMRILDSFRSQTAQVLIATDLAARGLDVPTLRTVVSYDAPRDIETHTHRVGRTGRAGVEGDAITLLTDEKQSRKMAGLFIASLQQAGSPVSPDLAALAKKYTPFRAAKMKEQSRANGNQGARERSRSRSRSPPLS